MTTGKLKITNRDEWDVITATNDGGVILRRYGDRKILTVIKGQTIEEALEEDARDKREREKRGECKAQCPLAEGERVAY